MTVGGHSVREGEWITLDGGDGSVYTGEIGLSRPEPPTAYETLMKWADKVRQINVRTNADTPQDSRLAFAKWARRELACAGPSICSSRILNIPRRAANGSRLFRK